MASDTLEALRVAIDEVDHAIQKALDKRATLVQQVGEHKKQLDEPQYYRPDREAKMLRARLEAYQGPLNKEDLQSIYRQIISACRALEHKSRVAFLGPKGTFSELAMTRHFGHAVDGLPVASITQVLSEVASGQAGFGVIPIENTQAGFVAESIDALLQHSIKVCGEVTVPVSFHLMRAKDCEERIERIYAHPHAEKQCLAWLSNYADGVEVVSAKSNADAAKLAASDKRSAAISNLLSEAQYNLEHVVSKLEGVQQNSTRFLIVGQQAVPATGLDKTAMILHLGNEPGLLSKSLAAFEHFNINMTMIAMRSHADARGYSFYLEVEGHQDDVSFLQAIDYLKSVDVLLNVIGSYPKAVEAH